MPTVAGLRRRGYTSASVREFCKRIGVTKMDNMVEMSMLEACLREELNADTPRAMAVLEPLKLVIENYHSDDVEQLSAANHPANESMGNRVVPFGKKSLLKLKILEKKPIKNLSD